MEIFNEGKNLMYNAIVKGVTQIKSGNVPTNSEFLEKGILTPVEFVEAGDLLVNKCPTWSWQAGDPIKSVAYLPKDKQFLMTRKVPCQERVKALESKKMHETAIPDIDGEWSNMSNVTTDGKDEEAQEVKPSTLAGSVDVDDDDDEGEVAEAENFNINEDNIDYSTVVDNETIEKVRTYDIHITFDLFHQTPKVWLFGYDESQQPLKPAQVFADVSQDHAKKTVTIDTHPHLGIPCAFIHPCKHASVMKKIVHRLLENGKTPRVDQYLFLFLKFISAVIPTIEYDFTIEIEG